jgi:RimJ/RimL family protein N-acetyltransferase
MKLRDREIELRPWCEEDAPAVYEACQDADIHQWIPVIPQPYTMEHALAFVRGEATPDITHSLAVTEDGTVAGSIGLRVHDQNRTGHIGYWCAPEARGRGVTTRALRLLSRYGLEDLDLERLELITDPDNRASQRVAEKVGFRREGILRSHLLHPDGRRRDSVMFSLLPGELT